MSHQLINSTLEDWSRSYTGAKFHAVLCDPPYGISFMGKTWDQVSAKAWGEALLPHLYPGALCLMFGSTRMWHKLATGMEEAGFEIWDTLMWLYGQGFPKGQDISKLIDKNLGNEREVIGTRTGGAGNTEASNYVQNKRDMQGKGGTGMGYLENGGLVTVTKPSEQSAAWSGHKTCALKPAWEPILAFRVPAKQTYADLALEYGSGCLNIDAARIGVEERTYKGMSADGSGTGVLRDDNWQPKDIAVTVKGRYPANLLLDKQSAVLLDEQTGNRPGCTSPSTAKCSSKYRPNQGEYQPQGPIYPDNGGASRFFYCAKASTSERNAGLEDFADKDRRTLGSGLTGISGDRSGAGGATKPLEMGSNKIKNHHPTVKPLALTQYLATLLLPPVLSEPRRLLVPFAGSGSEMIGALKAGWDEVVGIEQDTEQGYCQIAEARIAHHLELMSK